MTDDELIEEIIREIAEKHRIIVSQDDPILILQTINNRLLQNGQKAQREMLDYHKQELESIAMRWSEDAKEKAERILNVSLTASNEAMEKRMRSGAREIHDMVQTDIESTLKRLNRPLRDVHQIAVLNIVSATLSLIAAALVLWATAHV